MTTYVRVGGPFESSSSPGVNYHVSTDGESLSCDCPGWTNQTHYSDCPAVIRGVKCTCRSRVDYLNWPKESRTCKHLREVAPWVELNGGITVVLQRSLYYAPHSERVVGRLERQALTRVRWAQREASAREREASTQRTAAALDRLRIQVQTFATTPGANRRRPTPPTTAPTEPRIPIATGERAIRIRREEDE